MNIKIARLQVQVLVLVALFAVTRAKAQTNIIYVTNWVKAVETFRVVNGQLYNTEKSYFFAPLRGIVLAVTNDCLILNLMEEKRTYHSPPPSQGPQSYGNFIGSAPGQIAPRVGVSSSKWVLKEQRCFLKNYRDINHVAVGDTVNADAAEVGTDAWKGERIRVYDFGTPNYVMIVSTNGKRSHVVTTNQPAARPPIGKP